MFRPKKHKLLHERTHARNAHIGFRINARDRACSCASCLRADLHDTILSHATSSRQAYDMT